MTTATQQHKTITQAIVDRVDVATLWDLLGKFEEFYQCSDTALCNDLSAKIYVLQGWGV